MEQRRRNPGSTRERDANLSPPKEASTSLESDAVNEAQPLDTEVAAPDSAPAERPERAYPDAGETFRAEEELDDMLDEVTSRDPEALAADLARRHSPDPQGDLSPRARRFFDRTTELTADELDTEELEE